jgi:hypothetical protein
MNRVIAVRDITPSKPQALYIGELAINRYFLVAHDHSIERLFQNQRFVFGGAPVSQPGLT